MARSFRDTIPDEADGRLYVSLLNRDGTVALHDVAVEVSSPLVQQGDKFGAAAVNLLLELDDEGRPRLAIPPGAVGGVANYAHAKNGTVHELTGSGNNIRFVATAGFAEGDSMTVNGEACTARTISGEALWGGFFAKGAAVVCWREGNTLNFSGGGLAGSEAAKLTGTNLRAGVAVRVNGRRVQGTFTADATAGERDILDGKTAGAGGEMIRGSIPVQTGYSQTVPMYSDAPLTIPAGYYARDITVTPSYQAGTVITDFSAAGPLGSISTAANATQYYAQAGKIYLRKTISNGGDKPIYGDSCALNFANPVPAGFRYAIISGTRSGITRIGFADGPSGGLAVQANLNDSGAFDVTVTMGTHRYFRVESHISYVSAWSTSTSEVTITKITFYP